MKGIEDFNFYTVESDGKYVGKVREFPDLKCVRANRLDAVGGIVDLAAKRIREIHGRMAQQ